MKNLYYHPTSVLLLDDDAGFIANLMLNLDGTFNYIKQTVPSLAIQYINSNSTLSSNNQKYAQLNFSSDQADPATQATEIKINIQLKTIHEKIYDPNRFNMLSSIIIDYHMPHITGLEVCHAIRKDSAIRKIMLTGNTEFDSAIHAFNNNLIQKYIVKNNKKMIPTINEVLISESQLFFASQTESLYKSITTLTKTCLDKAYYHQLFTQCYYSANAVEYYLLDIYGSSVFIDEQANVSYLIIMPDKQFDNLYNILLQYDAPITLLDLVKKKTAPYLYSKEDYDISPLNWESKMIPFKPLDSQQKYFFCYLHNDNSLQIIDKKRIKSFNEVTDKEPLIP